jgi:hypothetical protein
MGKSGDRYGWFDFEPEPEGTGDGSGDPEKHILTIVEDPGGANEELAIIVHRICGGTYPINGALAHQKRLVGQHIVEALKRHPIDWDEISDKAIEAAKKEGL